MRRYIVLSVLLFILGLSSVSAKCSNAEIVQYQEQAKNISLNYDYKEDNDSISFSVRLANISPGLKIYDREHIKYYEYKKSEIKIGGFYQGDSYRFDIIATKCNNKKVGVKYLNTPFYNPYYKSELCVGIEDFPYCYKWSKKPKTYSEFYDAIQQYKESLKVENTKDEKSQKGVFDIIIDYYVQFYYIILPLIIISGIAIITLYNKKHDLV